MDTNYGSGQYSALDNSNNDQYRIQTGVTRNDSIRNTDNTAQFNSLSSEPRGINQTQTTNNSKIGGSKVFGEDDNLLVNNDSLLKRANSLGGPGSDIPTEDPNQ